MKRFILAILILFLSANLASGQEWHHDINKAKEEASAKNRPIVLVFKGSDWCAPCIKLDRLIFQTETFKVYAEDHFVLLEADFPRKKQNALPKESQKKNNALAETYNKSGIFPFVVLLDKNGKVLGETGYMKTSPSDYILHLESFNQ